MLLKTFLNKAFCLREHRILLKSDFLNQNKTAPYAVAEKVFESIVSIDFLMEQL